MTEIQVTTKTTTPVTLTSAGNTYLSVSSTGAIYATPAVNAAVAGAGLTITNAGKIIGGHDSPHYYLVGYNSWGAHSLYGVGAGVIIQTGGTLTNSGTIIGGYGGERTTAPFEYYNAGATGAAVDGFGTNSGLIVGGYGANGLTNPTNGGVGLSLTGDRFANSGIILGGSGGGAAVGFANAHGGAGGAGANVSGGATLSNTGSIAGGAGGEVDGSNSTGGTGGAGVSVNSGTLINTGSIAGGIGGPLLGANGTIGTGGAGVYINSGVLITSGTISGAEAVQFGATAGRLTVEQGAVFHGAVVGNGAVGDVLELASGAVGTGSYSFSGIGSSVSGFNTIALDAGPSWLLSGALLGETITGFSTADTLDLTNGIANGIANVNGAVVLSEGGVNIGTIHLASNFSLAYLNLASDGKGGTNLAYVANEISGTVATGITLSSTSTTILSKGLVENTAGSAVAELSLANRTLINYGQVTGGSFAGASFANGGQVINAVSGTISGGQNAIVIAGSAGTVNNAGTIAATSGDAVFASAGGFVSNNSTGHISGAASGVFIQGAAGTVVNAGSISGTTGNAVYFSAGGSVSNSGNISSADGDGILLGNGGTVANTGTINGNRAAVSFGGAGSDLLAIGAGAVFGGNVTASGTGNRLELTNTGNAATLAGVGSKYSGFQTIALDAGADWTIAGALLGETITGFDGFDTLDLTNLAVDSASIAGGVLTLSEAGVVLGTMNVSGFSPPGEIVLGSDGHGGTDIQLAGIVSGTYGAGITLRYKTTTITNTAAISQSNHYGRNNAVYGAGGMAWTLTNAGNIAGNFSAVYMKSGGSVYNAVQGKISASYYGVLISNGSGTLVNAGTILAARVGVELYGANDSIVNTETGTISGGEYGIINGGAAGTVVNAGTITANGNAYGSVVFWDGGTLVNSGSIGANAIGRSVVFATSYYTSSNNRLVIDPGSRFGGAVIAKGTGSNVLELGFSATASSISGIGSDFIGFNTIAIDPGNAWQLSGALTGETITGLRDGDTLDFTNVAAANSFSYTGGVLTLFENGVSVGTAALSGVAGAGDLSLSSGSGGVTVAVVPQTISSNLTNGILLDASVTTIASGITVCGGGNYAVYGNQNHTWQLINFGTISNLQQYGVYLRSGEVTNAASGQIYGRDNGVNVLYGTVVNAGTIKGVYGDGVFTTGTVMNSGTIISVHNDAVFLHGIYSNPVRLIVDPGAVLVGNVVADGVSRTLELASTSSVGTITGIGSSFTGFGTIDIDAGAAWTLSGNAAGLASGETINGFTRLDTIDLTGIAATSESFSSGVLSLYGASGLLATLDVTEGSGITSADFTISSDQGGGTDITLCFYPGTQLAAEFGAVTVEDIKPGTMLRIASGELIPVRWVGQSHISTRFADPLRSLPIRVKAGALGENLPQRDLLVSPDHALFIGGVLIQAGALVNGISIIRDAGVPEQFTYYHVELATHELLLAEGAATESFVDNVDRMNFFNWAEHEALGDTAPIEEMAYPRAKAHRQVPMHVRRMLDARAMAFMVAEVAA